MRVLRQVVMTGYSKNAFFASLRLIGDFWLLTLHLASQHLRFWQVETSRATN